MIWFLDDLARLKAEREAVEALVTRVEWLQPTGWRLDSRLRLVWECILTAGSGSHQLILRYPESFPNSPPSVLPQDSDALLSGHQYGPGGELCLEFRADNWTPDTMGFQMLESAHRLLSGENPAPNERATVPSAHHTTLGQELRTEKRRLSFSSTIAAILQSLAVGTSLIGKCQVLIRKSANLYVVNSLQLSDSEFIDPAVPSILAIEGSELNIVFARISHDAKVPEARDRDSFLQDCSLLGLPEDSDVIVILQSSRTHAYRIFANDNSIYRLGVVLPESPKQRVSGEYASLQGKSVGVVGCGSLGSKVAVSLARCGIGLFFLVDDDVLLPDNVVRNDLDWRDVGLNKADALAAKISLVNPLAKVRTRRVRIAGQEATETADDVLISLGQSDLIIDATANPVVQNVIAGILAREKKIFVWGEVFAGGIGGLVARCRPGKEPPVPWMRRQIENWFAEQKAPPVRAGVNYEQDGESHSLIADDADVGAIAASMTRIAVDSLLDRNPSFFQDSVYALGLAPGSIFSQSFETFPIKLMEAPPDTPPPSLSADEILAEGEAIKTMLTKLANEAASKQQNN